MHIPSLLLIAYTAPTALAWGSLGHRTVAYLASLYLTPEATKFTNRLLNGQDISEAALFPDKIAHIPSFAYTRAWHYIDAADDPPRSCGINMTRDCLDSSGGCVVSAIANHTSRVLDPHFPTYLRGQSLRFVLHFIGDIHQPLHTEKEDRGGNGIEVVFDGKRTNLHSVWDSLVPNKYRKRDEWWPGPPGDPRREREEEAAFLWAKELFDSDVRDAGDGVSGECTRDAAQCALEWAGEANGFVCSYVLRDDVEGVQGKDLGGEYYEGAVDIIDGMVRKGGRRLAAWLNLMAEAVKEEEEGFRGEELLVVQRTSRKASLGRTPAMLVGRSNG